MGSLDFEVRRVEVEIDVQVDISEVVRALDRVEGLAGEGRALAKLAADAVALANDWDRGSATRADVIARAEALAAGYREVM